MQPIEMYTRSLAWAEGLITQSTDLDRLMRAADAFITTNSEIFATKDDQSLLAKTF